MRFQPTPPPDHPIDYRSCYWEVERGSGPVPNDPMMPEAEFRIGIRSPILGDDRGRVARTGMRGSPRPAAIAACALLSGSCRPSRSDCKAAATAARRGASGTLRDARSDGGPVRGRCACRAGRCRVAAAQPARSQCNAAIIGAMVAGAVVAAAKTVVRMGRREGRCGGGSKRGQGRGGGDLLEPGHPTFLSISAEPFRMFIYLSIFLNILKMPVACRWKSVAMCRALENRSGSARKQP